QQLRTGIPPRAGAASRGISIASLPQKSSASPGCIQALILPAGGFFLAPCFWPNSSLAESRLENRPAHWEHGGADPQGCPSPPNTSFPSKLRPQSSSPPPIHFSPGDQSTFQGTAALRAVLLSPWEMSFTFPTSSTAQGFHPPHCSSRR
uniref:Uncharacterized protein n=1 Tax=Cairina moschata TaxID=8855 RepID=A0A8C3D6Y2_CAIMO